MDVLRGVVDPEDTWSETPERIGGEIDDIARLIIKYKIVRDSINDPEFAADFTDEERATAIK